MWEGSQCDGKYSIIIISNLMRKREPFGSGGKEAGKFEQVLAASMETPWVYSQCKFLNFLQVVNTFC